MIATLPSSNPMMFLPSSLFLLTSPRLRGEVEIRASEFRVRGTLRESRCGGSPSPQPSPRKRGAREHTALAASPQHRLAALDDGDASRLHLGFERNHAAVLPQLHGHGLAGID